MNKEEFPHDTEYNDTPNAYRYAVIFAADCEPNAIAATSQDQPTETHAALAVALGRVADELNKLSKEAGKNFYPVAYVEAAAQFFNRYPNATLHRLCEAGQLEVDDIRDWWKKV